MKIAKILFTFGLLLVFTGLLLTKQEEIITIVNSYILPGHEEVTLGEKNEYYRDYDFMFVQNTDNFSPNSYQDILNIYYTAINAGKNSFTFYCPQENEECLDDVKTIANNQDLLSDINNYVHPYNGFAHIETEYDTLGKVTISLVKTYSDDEIEEINEKIDELYPQLVNDNDTLENKIKSVHDFIINNNIYDSDRSDRNIYTYKSDKAYGALFQGHAVCGGYTDLMQLFLERMGIKSYRVASEQHVWNAVFLNNKWYNLDLTWDDPVTSDGKQYLKYNYFLIDTKELLKIEKTEHNFDQDVYIELKEANYN